MKSDILIVGAGPAGLAAAASAAGAGAKITILDDNFAAGGQIWRAALNAPKDPRAHDLWQQLQRQKNVRFQFQTRVVHARTDPADGIELLAESAEKSALFQAKKLILATGARELLLPFPGWTLPGVMGAGGLQALAKNGFPVAGKRVLIAGSGPLLLAVAASLLERGAIVTHILEQTSLPQLMRFALSLLATPGKITQALELKKILRKLRYHSNSYVLAAQSDGQLEGQLEGQLRSVRVQINGREQVLACDYLACAYGLLPNSELAAALGCALTQDAGASQVRVDQWQQSSLPQVYCAGEGTGVGGVELALAEGHIAGLAATGMMHQAASLWGERQRWQAFSRRLATAFTLRPELRQLCEASTLVCRCEDVAFGQVQAHANWRSAKLHTRCGMGACQGRICGPATRYLFNWAQEAGTDVGRLPLAAARIASIRTLQAPRQQNEI